MKSKRAKEKLNTLLKKQEQGFFFFREDVVCDAIIFAEQDAEARAVKATKSMIDGMVIATDIEKQAMMDYYNYCYNNGGQSDE